MDTKQSPTNLGLSFFLGGGGGGKGSTVVFPTHFNRNNSLRLLILLFQISLLFTEKYNVPSQSIPPPAKSPPILSVEFDRRNRGN